MVSWVKKMSDRLKAWWVFLNTIEPDKDIPFADPDPSKDKNMLGMYAQQALTNPSIMAAVEKLEHEYFLMWKRSLPIQDRERESVWHRLQALNEIRLKLNGFVNEMLQEQQIKTEKAASQGTAKGE